MAEQTRSWVRVGAAAAAVMDVIADFEAYPTWAQGVMVSEVRSTFPGGRAEEVYFEIEATPIKDSYTLVYDWHGDQWVTWRLGQAGTMLRQVDGTYRLQPLGPDTVVTYDLAAELGIPMIGMLRRKAEKVIIDAALTGLKQRVESLRR